MTMRWVSRWASFASALALSGALGCDRMPDAAAATRAFGDHRSDIDAVEGVVRAALREIPPAVTCADPATVGTDLEAAQAFVRCHEAQGAQREAERAVWTTLRRDRLPDLLDAHTSVLGVEVVSGSITSEAGTVFPSNVGAASGG
jgi:hypothetical protein